MGCTGDLGCATAVSVGRDFCLCGHATRAFLPVHATASLSRAIGHSDAGGDRCIDLPSYHLRGTLCEGGGGEDPADDLQL